MSSNELLAAFIHVILWQAHLHFDLASWGVKFEFFFSKMDNFSSSIWMSTNISCLMELLRMTESFLEKSSEAAIFVDDLPSQQPIRDRGAPTALSTQLAVIGRYDDEQRSKEWGYLFVCEKSTRSFQYRNWKYASIQLLDKFLFLHLFPSLIPRVEAGMVSMESSCCRKENHKK